MSHVVPLLITITPLPRAGRYSVSHAGTTLIPSTGHPFVDSARALVAAGQDPTLTLAMTRDGVTVDLAGNLGAAAQLTVSETVRSGPRWAKWSPNPFWAET